MGKLNFEGLSKINDSLQPKPLVQRIKDSLEDTETTEEAKEVIREAIASGEDPQEVAEAAVDVLSSAIDVLEEKVAAAEAAPAAPEVPVGDALVQKVNALKSKIKDELEETETTEDAVKVALANLDGEAPEVVLQAVTEVLAETVDALEEKVNEAPAIESIEEMTDEEIEDSFKALRQARLKRAQIRDSKNRLKLIKDSYHEGDPFDACGIKGKVHKVLEDHLEIETTNEDGDVEIKEVAFDDLDA
jgi:preprotein translocase subunit YajC